jgi:histidyl-tRNA synthetase
MIQSAKGTNDLLPTGSPKVKPEFLARGHAYIVQKAGKTLERMGAKYIQTPMFENPEVIKRGVGGSTDIVRKEMFMVHNTWKAAEESDEFILRPEGTAAIARAYLQHGLKQFPTPLKLWTAGAMFRAERPQQGRYRQFHQVDLEVYGLADAIVDAECIEVQWSILRDLGLERIEIKLGSVGSAQDRLEYNQYLRELFGAHPEKLSEDSRARLILNPMRILDSKDAGDQSLIAELKPQMMLERLGPDSRAHFDQVCGYLDAWGVPYTLDPTIVRGLDYYTRTAWEIHHQGVGAKSALGGGGRYDGLVQELGGPATPAIGWAFGIERVLIALHDEGVAIPDAPQMLVYVGALEEQGISYAASLARAARTLGHAEFSYKSKKAGKHLEDALKKGAMFIALVGESELEQNTVALKNLSNREEQILSREGFLEMLGKSI